MTLRIAVSGIPRGFQSPRTDGNWLTEEHKERILSVSNEIELLEIPPQEAEEHQGKIEGVEILLAEGGNKVHYPGELDWEDYHKFFTPSLKWVQLCSTGFGANLTSEVRLGEVILTNAPNLHTIPITESVIAAMLDHAKRFKQRREDQERHLWRQLKAEELYNRTVLLIGLGNIGGRAARLCKAFGMNVIGTKREPEPVENVDKVFTVEDLKEYLPKADYIVIAAPLTPETENMISEPEFRAMKRTAYLINIGRGKIIYEPVLLRALQEGWIAGAYLDVFGFEPLPKDHPLWDMKNVFLIPHDSHSSPYIGDRVIEIFVDNLKRYVEGDPLKHVCNPDRGY
jgi:phosphoglycerate dehydrogenase-like enzyme